MSTVTIVGAGLMGTAVAWPLADNGHEVRLVGTHLDAEIIASCLDRRYHPRLRRILPDSVQPFYIEQLAEALDGAEVIVSGVNSLGVHWIGRTLGPLLWPGATIIAVTKGLEATSGGMIRILPDVLREELPAGLQDKVTLAAIGGPCIAGELAGRRPTCVVFTSHDEPALARLRAVFSTGYYHIWLSTDVVGVEVCAALKNAYTVAVGLALGALERDGGVDQAGAGMHNLAAALFGVSAAEMTRLVTLMGGRPEKVFGLPGGSVCHLCRRAHSPIGDAAWPWTDLLTGSDRDGRRNAGRGLRRPPTGQSPAALGKAGDHRAPRTAATADALPGHHRGRARGDPL